MKLFKRTTIKKYIYNNIPHYFPEGFISSANFAELNIVDSRDRASLDNIFDVHLAQLGSFDAAAHTKNMR